MANQSSLSNLPMFSFDIFDTLLTRRVGDPHEVFRICGQSAINAQILSNISPSAFQLVRVASETRARAFHGGEVTLSEIYTELGYTLSLSDDIIEQLINLELFIETKLIIPIAKAKYLVEQSRKLNSSILFLSDMYLPEDFLLERLRYYGFWEDGDHIYISGQVRKSKTSGEMFHYVLNNLQIKPLQLIHSGNNLQADINAAKKIGIQTNYIPEANLNRFEQILQQHTIHTEGISSFWAGASRLARLSVEAKSGYEATIRDVAAGVAAPAIVAYVIWVLQSASREGLDCLYFLSRDGEILLKVAKLLAPKISPDIEIRYLHVSRQALRLPGIIEVNDQVLDWIFEGTDILTIKSLMMRVDLYPSDFEALLESWGFDSSSWERNLNYRERIVLKTKFSSDEIANAILESSAKKRQILRAYLAQEGIFSGKRYGIVDLGWRGSLQISLEKVIKEVDSNFPVAYYFGLLQSKSLFQNITNAFFFDFRKKTGINNPRYNVDPLMELFCSGSQGTTLGYCISEGVVTPLLKEKENTLVNRWGLPILQETVLSFTHIILDTEPITFLPKLFLKIIDELFSEFLLHPSREEVLVFSKFPYFDDPNECYHMPWAPPLTVLDLLKFSINPTRALNKHRASWLTGSIANSSKFVKLLLPVACKLNSVSLKVRFFIKLFLTINKVYLGKIKKFFPI